MNDFTCWVLASTVLALILLTIALLWLGRRPEPPKPEPRHQKRPNPYPGRHGLKSSPTERWLYGDDDRKDDGDR
jgi:hypothetical protein